VIPIIARPVPIRLWRLPAEESPQEPGELGRDEQAVVRVSEDHVAGLQGRDDLSQRGLHQIVDRQVDRTIVIRRLEITSEHIIAAKRGLGILIVFDIGMGDVIEADPRSGRGTGPPSILRIGRGRLEPRPDPFPVDDGDPNVFLLRKEDLAFDLEIVIIQGELKPFTECDILP
jgi:hypothetical protein